MGWVTATGKFDTHVASDGQSGWMKTYQGDRDTGDWTLMWEITWNADGTGSWVNHVTDVTTTW